MSYAHVASVERSCRQAVGMLTEAWANASAAARIVRAQGHRRVLGDGGRELRRGTLSAHPVMLVHGLGADKSCFSTMEGVLHRAGHTVYSVSYSCWDADVAACANDLERETSWLLAETGASRVTLRQDVPDRPPARSDCRTSPLSSVTLVPSSPPEACHVPTSHHLLLD